MGGEYRGNAPTWMGISIRKLTLATLTVQFSAFILILHYSRVMPTPDGHRYLPSTAVFLTELLKLVVCLTISLYEASLKGSKSMTASSLFSTLVGTIFSGDSWQMAIPASLYTLANSLQYVAISNLDAATFHVTYQFKIIVTAIFSVFMLRTVINGRQWLSLVLLMIGVAIVSLPSGSTTSLASSHHTHAYVPRAENPIREHFKMAAPGSNLKKRSATYEGIQEDEMALYNPGMDASIGLIVVFVVCLCSGLAGVYFEKLMKEGPKNVSLWIRNVQISVYSLFPAFFIGIIFLDGENVAKHGFFAGYNWVVVLSIVVQSFGGIVAAFCIFYADNISKNFAVSISMILSSLASFVFLDFHLTTNFVIGTAIVLLATYLYGTQELRPIPPVIRIDNYEKSDMANGLDSPRDMSIQIPKTALNVEESARATSRPGSPSHKKRKSENLGYYSKSDD